MWLVSSTTPENGPEKHSGRRVSNDRVQPETSEYAFGQLRDDDQQADGQQCVFEHVRIPGRGLNGAGIESQPPAGAGSLPSSTSRSS